MGDFKPTKAFLLTPRPCRACGQMMSRAFLEQKLKTKSANLSKSLRASESKGRTRSMNYDKARALRAEGKSIREIAAELNCSTWSVHRAIHERKPPKEKVK